MIELGRIRDARERIAAKVRRTPLLPAETIGERAGVALWLKCENLQVTGAFKARGALNKVLSLSEEERARGLVAASAGNHAIAVAWAGAIAGAAVTVVMPAGAPRSKLDAARGFGAEIIIHDDPTTIFDRLAEVRDERGLTFVHPFDDAEIMAGAGTVGLEIIEDLPDIDAVVVPIAGGGLLGGIASVMKTMRPEVRVYGVELETGSAMTLALRTGKPVQVKRERGQIADGLTAPYVGELPLTIAREAVDGVVTVGDAEIVEAMRLLLTSAKLYVEGGGAASTAGLLAGRIGVPAGSRVVCVVTGGNVDLERVTALFG